MSASAANLQLIQTVARRLGALRDRVVFIGGATTTLLVTDAGAASIRATLDVDLIANIRASFGALGDTAIDAGAALRRHLGMKRTEPFWDRPERNRSSWATIKSKLKSVAIATITFSKKSAKGLPSKSLRRVVAAMKCDGAVSFANLFPMPLLRRVRSSVMRRHGTGELRERGLVRDIGGRYAAVLPFEGPFLEPTFYANPALQEILSALLGTSYCIGSLETVVSLPGSREQHQHIDGPLRFDRKIGKKKEAFNRDLSDLPPYAVTLCVPLCAVDEDNGPTAICPGSHRTALKARLPSESQILRQFPVEHMVGKFGQSFLFDYRTFHFGTPNMTREPRPILMFVFTRSWFRDPNLTEVDQSVVISKRNLARIPERHRHLFLLAPAGRRSLWARKKK